MLGSNEIALAEAIYRLGPFPVDIAVQGFPGWVGSANPSFATLVNVQGGEAMLNFVTIDTVYDGSCGAVTQPGTDPPSYFALANALESLPDFDVIETADTEMDGMPARYIELYGPTNSDCAVYPLWLSDETCRCVGGGPQHYRFWVVAADGVTFVVDATDTPAVQGQPGTSAAVRSELEAMVRSIDINPEP